MALFTAADVKALRERLGAGMLDSKNALVEAEGKMERAIEILRLRGLKGSAKRADRSTSEGLVAAAEGDGSTTLIELVCETDFVAKNEKFGDLAQKILGAVAASGAQTVEAAREVSLGGSTVAEVIIEEAAILGEKVELRRVAVIRAEHGAVYLHKTSKDLPPQVGVVVGYSGGDAQTARSIAQHIAFADPQYVSRDDVPADVVAKERHLVTEISKNEGKPEAALPKIVEGRLHGFFKQVALLDQDYAKDNKLTVGRVLSDVGMTVTGFVRFKVGV
jgi:elongation factor Ts